MKYIHSGQENTFRLRLKFDPSIVPGPFDSFGRPQGSQTGKLVGECGLRAEDMRFRSQ